MFSRTTVESSIKIPMTSVIAISEIVSSVRFMIFIANNVTPSDVGIATMTTTALRHDFKKNNITTPVRMIPSTSVCSTDSSCCSVKVAWLCATANWTPGNCARSLGNAPITSLATLTSLAVVAF